MISNSDTRCEKGVVLVVGGRGFIGSQIVRRLVAADWRPHLFGPPVADDLLADIAGSFTETAGSVEDRAALVNAIARSGARAVVTTAAHGSGRQGLMRSGEAEGDKALSVNVLGLRNVFEAARESGVARVVWTSSTVVYGPSSNYPPGRVDENAPVNPQTFYGLTKRLGEDVAQYYRTRHALETIGLRLPLVLGPGLWYRGAAAAVIDVIRAAASGARHALVFHDEPIDLMHVSDAADAVVASLDPKKVLSTIYNINGFTARLSDIVAALEARTPGYKVDFDRRPAELLFPLIDDARFRREADFKPAHGLAELIAGIGDDRRSHA